jgi:hypothetical protein
VQLKPIYMENFENSWVKGYYDEVGFFSWEPQHLERKKYVESTLNTFDKVEAHLRTMEVTLNHQIKQFLRLAPDSLRNRLFRPAFGREIPGEFIMAGSLLDIDKKYQLNNAVQPDFLFTTDDTTVSLEMKLVAKSSVAQVLKYALLALAVEQQHGKQMQHFLAFLGVFDFSKLWPKGIASENDLRQALDQDKSSFLDGKAKRFQEQESRFFEIVSSMQIGFISYGTLAELLNEEAKLLDGSVAAQVYRKLLRGMVGEMESRLGATLRKS